MKHTALVGRIFFALAMMGSGLMQLIHQDFVRLVPKSPTGAGNPYWWAIVSGGILVAAGAALVFEKKRRFAAIILATLFVLVFLLYVPGLIANPHPGFMWTNPCKTLALLGGAVLLTASVSESINVDAFAKVGWRWRLCAVCYGIFFVVGGIQHYVYLDFVIQLVPSWMPLRRFWACFTGAALIAGGLGINFRPTARVAAVASGVMVFLWVIMLHIPRAFAMSTEPGETSAIFEALALSGTALLLSGTCGTPSRLSADRKQ